MFDIPFRGATWEVVHHFPMIAKQYLVGIVYPMGHKVVWDHT
jgi:hypothetical protein